jgi:3-oxoadipate enol-lactonase
VTVGDSARLTYRLDGPRDADLRQQLRSIRAPTLVMGGALDDATPPVQTEALSAAIPGSTRVVIPNVAHLSNLEAPETFMRAVLTHLVRA